MEGYNLVRPYKLKRGDWLIDDHGWRKIKHLRWQHVGRVEIEFHGSAKERMIRYYLGGECEAIVRRLSPIDDINRFESMLRIFMHHKYVDLWTDLHRSLGDLRMTLYFLRGSTCDINTHCGTMQFTPLHLAVMNTTLSGVPLVRLLLDHGANPSRINADGQNALDFALWRDNWSCAELLVARGVQSERAGPMHERWRVRWALIYYIRKRYRFPREIVQDIMSWI